MQVQGVVTINNGAADIRLAPIIQHRPPQTPRPTVEEVQQWNIHASRLPFTRDHLASAMNVVQQQLSPPIGVQKGQWTEAATERLKENLSKRKKGAKRVAEDEGQKLLALEDKKDKKRKAEPEQEEVGGEESQESSSSSDSSSSSSSSNSNSTTKSWLRAENNSLLEAIQCHQRIEDDNADLTRKIGILTEENLRLHARLRAGR